MSEVIAEIRRQRALPILRSSDAEDAVETALACRAAGMDVVELTQSTPSVNTAVAELCQDGITVGVGTITTAEQVRSCAEAGARFVVSYAALSEVVESALDHELGVIAGALTPTEVLACDRAGAEAIKLFPARIFTPEYLADLRTVMPGVQLMVTGGIRANAAAIQKWLDAGAFAVGVGSDLGSAVRDGREHVEERCRAALGAHSLATTRARGTSGSRWT